MSNLVCNVTLGDLFPFFCSNCLVAFPVAVLSTYKNMFVPRRNYVLRITDSIGDAGIFRWEILLCLLAAWIGVYFCMWKGVKSSGKVTIWNKICSI